jgi:hypothetical protein
VCGVIALNLGVLWCRACNACIILVCDTKVFPTRYGRATIVSCTFCRVTTFRLEHDQHRVQKHGRHGRCTEGLQP